LLSADPPDSEIVLLRGLEELRTDPSIDPVVKAVFLRAFLAEAKKLSPNNVTQIDQMLSKLDTINTNVLWTNPSPDRATQDARQEIHDCLDEMADLPGLAFRTSVINRLHRASLSRNPRCVGQVLSTGRGFRMELGRSEEPEVWIVVSSPEGEPAVHIAALADEEGVLQIKSEVSDFLYAGQPVFAPSDGKLTGGLVRGIVEDIPAPERMLLERLPWPASWPVNGRNVELAHEATSDGRDALLHTVARSDHRPSRP